MPIFEYRCLDCHETFEMLFLSRQSSKEPSPCPACGSESTERQISTFATGVGTPTLGSSSCSPTSSRFR